MLLLSLLTLMSATCRTGSALYLQNWIDAGDGFQVGQSSCGGASNYWSFLFPLSANRIVAETVPAVLCLLHMLFMSFVFVFI